MSILIDGIVGARPNMMKMAPLARAMMEDGTFRLRLIHTGQHYDDRMSDIFFSELGLPSPTFSLQVGSGSHGKQTAAILERYEAILLSEERPRGVIVVGDVNSTLACALAAAKLSIPVAHVEAGLRSGDRAMPEEINRIVTDALSDVLLVSDPDGLIHLAREGHEKEKLHFVGNIMVDTLLKELPEAQHSPILDELNMAPKTFAYLTLHRPSNVDNPVVLSRIMNLLGELSQDIPMIFALHPRTRASLEQANIPLPNSENFRVIQPQGYRNNLRLIHDAQIVLTDSGGIQEETSVLNVPCITLRDQTERPITVQLGSSELVGNDETRLRAAWKLFKTGTWKRASPIPLWDGKTAERIVARLRKVWS